MPVAGAIKLDIVTAANDKATATLRAIQGELRKTEEQIKQINATSEDSAFLSADEKSGLDGRRRKMFLEEAAALEEATQRRREQVLADRAARTEQLASASAAGRFKGAVEGASKVQEFFNKTLGVAGFVGVIGTAVVGLIEGISSLVKYRGAVEEANERQDIFNALLAETGRIMREIRLAEAGDGGKELIKAQTEQAELLDKYLELQAERVIAETALADATRRRAALQKQFDDGLMITSTQIIEGQETIRQLTAAETRNRDRIAAAKQREEVISRRLGQLQSDANTLTAAGAGFAQDLAGWFGATAANVGKLVEGLGGIKTTASWAPWSEESPEDKAKRKKREEEEARDRARAGAAEAKATADRIRDMQRQMTLARALAGVESDSAREQIQLELQVAQIREDVAARRIKSQAEASAMIEKAETEFRLAEEARLRAAEDGYAQAFEAALEREEERRAKVLERTEDLRRELAVLEAGTAADEARLEAARQLADLESRLGKGELTAGEAAAQAELIARIAEVKAAKEAANAETERSLELLAEYGITAEQVGRAIEGLTGTFAGLGGNLSGITSLWAEYERQQSKLGKSAADQAKAQRNLGNAIAGTIGQTGAAIASGMEDRKAAAFLEGGFYAIASAAAFISGNIPVGVGYAGIAADFFALAGKGGGKGTSGSSGSKSSSSPSSGTGGQASGTSGTSGPFVSVVQQFGNGIVFGMAQDIGKASADAAHALRGTGHDQSRGFG